MSDERLPNPAARVGHLLILKMSARSFFWAKNEQFGKSLLFALSLFLKEQMRDRSFCRSFWKSDRAIAKKERSLICSFAKSDKKSNLSFALFKRANERAIAQMLFWKERKWAMSKWANARLPSPDFVQLSPKKIMFLQTDKNIKLIRAVCFLFSMMVL